MISQLMGGFYQKKINVDDNDIFTFRVSYHYDLVKLVKQIYDIFKSKNIGVPSDSEYGLSKFLSNIRDSMKASESVVTAICDANTTDTNTADTNTAHAKNMHRIDYRLFNYDGYDFILRFADVERISREIESLPQSQDKSTSNIITLRQFLEDNIEIFRKVYQEQELKSSTLMIELDLHCVHYIHSHYLVAIDSTFNNKMYNTFFEYWSKKNNEENNATYKDQINRYVTQLKCFNERIEPHMVGDMLYKIKTVHRDIYNQTNTHYEKLLTSLTFNMEKRDAYVLQLSKLKDHVDLIEKIHDHYSQLVCCTNFAIAKDTYINQAIEIETNIKEIRDKFVS